MTEQEFWNEFGRWAEQRNASSLPQPDINRLVDRFWASAPPHVGRPARYQQPLIREQGPPSSSRRNVGIAIASTAAALLLATSLLQFVPDRTERTGWTRPQLVKLASRSSRSEVYQGLADLLEPLKSGQNVDLQSLEETLHNALVGCSELRVHIHDLPLSVSDKDWLRDKSNGWADEIARLLDRVERQQSRSNDEQGSLVGQQLSEEIRDQVISIQEQLKARPSQPENA